MKQYVQHISGQGEKWAVINSNDHQWGICHNISSVGHHWLPKSEYRLCDPPEQWVDVTGECRVDDYSNRSGFFRSGFFWSILHAPTGANVISKCYDGYRLRKIDWQNRLDDPQWGFIVEKKVSDE